MEPCIVELATIVDDYHLRDTVLIDNGFPHKVLQSGFYNVGQMCGLDLFGEIINCH